MQVPNVSIPQQCFRFNNAGIEFASCDLSYMDLHYVSDVHHFVEVAIWLSKTISKIDEHVSISGAKGLLPCESGQQS